MPLSDTRQRLVSALLFFGACILVFRAVTLVSEGTHTVFVGWVYGLLLAELALDLIALVVMARWFAFPGATAGRLALQVTAFVVVLHAIRVAVFALGRVGPWVNFDVRPAARARHAETWTWAEVWFASSMSLISLVILIVVWRRFRSPKGRSGFP